MPLNRPIIQQRPKDPNRFRTIDVTPDGAQLQHDPQYQQMVADVSNRAGNREPKDLVTPTYWGWLFAQSTDACDHPWPEVWGFANR
jgi:hypothetical protein